MTYGECISHPHNLNWRKSEHIFQCNGCFQVGIGSRFSCSDCNFDLHIHCAEASPRSGLHHPFHPKCILDFLRFPPRGFPCFCDACDQRINGFFYHCLRHDYNLHPCCAGLPHALDIDDGLRLRLHPRMSAACDWCGWKDKHSWCYRSDCKNYNFHVACVKEMLLDNLHQPSGSGGSGMPILFGNRMPIVRAGGDGLKRSWKEKVKKFCKKGAIVVRFVIAAVLGDPTTAFAGIIYSLIHDQ